MYKPKNISYKANPTNKVIKLLNFRGSMSPRTFYHEFLADLLYRTAEHGYRLELISDSEAVRKQLETPGNDMIITFCASLEDYSLVRRALHSKIINLLPNFVENVSPSLIIDDNNLVEIQIQRLVEAGHRRIAYLYLKSDEKYIRAQNCRWDTFHRLSFELNLKFDRRYLIKSTDRDLKRISAEVFELFKAADHPTAILLASDLLVPAAYSGILNAGLKPGKDIAVIGTDNRPWCDYVLPSLTSAGFDYCEGFKKLIEMIAEIENGNDGRIIKLPVKIYERESVNKI